MTKASKGEIIDLVSDDDHPDPGATPRARMANGSHQKSILGQFPNHSKTVLDLSPDKNSDKSLSGSTLAASRLSSKTGSEASRRRSHLSMSRDAVDASSPPPKRSRLSSQGHGNADPILLSDENETNSKRFTLPRGLETPKSKSAKIGSNRKQQDGSPMNKLNQNLLKRARESLENASGTPQSSKRQRLNQTGPLVDRPISDRDTSQTHGKSSESRQRTTSLQRAPRHSHSIDVASENGSMDESRNGGSQSRSSVPSNAVRRNKITSTTNSPELNSALESPRRRNLGQSSSKGPSSPSPFHRSTRQSKVSDSTAEGNSTMGTRSSFSSNPADLPTHSGLPRQHSSEDDQGYVSLGSSNLEEMVKDLNSSVTTEGLFSERGNSQTSPEAGQNSELTNGISPKTSRDVPPLLDSPGKSTKTKSQLDSSERLERRPRHRQARVESDEFADIDIASDADAQLKHEATQGLLQEQQSQRSDSGAKFSDHVNSLPAVSNLSLGKQVEMVLGKYLEEFRGDNEHWTKIQMKRARFMTHETSIDSEKTSFKAMKPLQFSIAGKESTGLNVWGIETLNSTGKPTSKSSMSAPYTSFETRTLDVPNYAHYVSIKDNVLAPNATTLHCWPYFGDDMQEEMLNLDEQYDFDILQRERKITQLLKAQQYEQYVEAALIDLGCSWADVLRFLLEAKPDVGTEADAQTALKNRHEYCNEDFTRNAERWVQVLASLPSSSPEKLARVAVLCENFQKLLKFSVWHIARRSEYCKLPESDSNEDLTDRDLTCRICLKFDCPLHGEIKESPEDDNLAERESRSSASSSAAKVVNTDIVNPPKINYRTRICFPELSSNPAEGEPTVVKYSRNRSAHHWASGNFKKADERGPFYPCHHPGFSCEDACCSCYQSRVPCEKICSCPPDCSRKFHGCACASKANRKLVCTEDPDCACYQSGRECDPDLCGGCGVCDVVDPINQGMNAILQGRCRNASLQRGVVKHTLLGDSGIHGLGLYACEDIREHEFVGEYIGEIILKEEADRRGAVYEHQRLSYLFSLNAAQEIDSTYFGNKMRFINHAPGSKANLRARITLVNTVHRIGLYAERHIRAGEELLFDYGPMFPNEQLGGKKTRKSAPHVRNAKLVEEFYDVSKYTDELGNIRARKVTKTNGKSKTNSTRKGTGGTRKASAARVKPADDQPQPRKQLGPARIEKDNDSTAGKDAGARLVAFNIAEDHAGEPMEVDEDESDDFVPSASSGREQSEESELDGTEHNSDSGRRVRRRRQ